MSESTSIPGDPRRRAQRREARAASTMRAGGASPHDVTVVDLSATGLRIVSNADLAMGQEISIGLAGAGATRAFVAWRRGNQYGCVFARPLSAEDEALAFSNAAPVTLGRAPIAQKDEVNGLDEIYRQHRTWALPPDAIAAILLFLGGIGYLASLLVHR